MDWPLAIARNRTALLAVVASIAALIGGRGGGVIARHVRNAALALLRPAESAARRLIVIAARGLALAPRPAPVLAASPALAGAPGPGATGRSRPPAFRLFDPRKRFVFGPVGKPMAGSPRIRTFWGPAPTPPPPPDRQGPVDPTRLRLRLAALERALADLPRQARRLARWRARRDRAERPHQPMRPGRPPGWRARSDRAVDRVLRECHLLAHDALRQDTS